MNSEIHFLPSLYSQENQLNHADERFIERPGFGGPFVGELAGGLLAGSLLSPYGYDGYGGYGYGSPYGYGSYGYGGCC